MTEESITVYGPDFSVPGAAMERQHDTILIAYVPPGEHRSRADWFHALEDGGKRAGCRMGDHDDPPLRYSVTTTMQEAA